MDSSGESAKSDVDVTPFAVRPPVRKRLGGPVVTLRNVFKTYALVGRPEGVSALSGVSLTPSTEFYSVRKGEFVIIRGPSGGGKTTLLNIIGTIDKPTRGEVEVLGTAVDATSKDNFLADLRLRRIGFVFQTFNLIATMSAFENVSLPMTLLGRLKGKALRRHAKELLQMVGLGDRLSHLPSELSGGEQQRVTIARSLANDPDILLLDEPTGDLDSKNTLEIMDLLLRINIERGTTMVMVTHNPDLECYADRCLYVQDGRFVKQAINLVQSRLNYDRYMSLMAVTLPSTS